MADFNNKFLTGKCLIASPQMEDERFEIVEGGPITKIDKK